MNYAPGYFDPAPCASSDIFFQSVFQAAGTSYQGDFLWLNDSFGGVSAAARFGAFMRPYELMPNPSELVLFADARFHQAWFGTQEFFDANGFTIPESVPAWHDPSGHNVLLADGHALTTPINVSGSVIDPIQNFDPLLYPNRSLMIRGAGWRIDAFPEQFIYERSIGNPLVAPLTQGLMIQQPQPDLRSPGP